MSTDPRIEAAARRVAVENGYPDFLYPDGMTEVTAKAYRDQAARILAAADKAATITTVEELDALPVESVVRDAYGIVFENDLLDQSKARKWATLIDNELVASARISPPARVLHLGGS